MPVVGNQTNVSVVNIPQVTFPSAQSVNVVNTPTVNVGNSPAVKRSTSTTRNISNAGYTVPGGTYFEGSIILGTGGTVTINGLLSLSGVGVGSVHKVTLGAGTSIAFNLINTVISGVEYNL